MSQQGAVNILLVDDQPGKLLTYEAILHDLDENLLRAGSGREALEHLLKTDVAVILVDVCMPDLDGFQLAAMIREHPRFQKTAIIFISAIHLSDMDRLRGYEMGAVDYVPVPVIPEVLRAKVRVFCDLYRKTRQLELLNRDLEKRVAERTAELETAAEKLVQSERRRSLALAAGNMGSWEWDREADQYVWDEGQYRIFGVDPSAFQLTSESIRSRIHPDDWTGLQIGIERLIAQGEHHQSEFRVVRPDGETRWCIGTAATSKVSTEVGNRISGVTIDITERKKAEERQALLAREVDHRAKNALALVQSIIRLTKASDQQAYVVAVEGRIRALSKAHNVLSQSRWQGANLQGLVEEEFAPYRSSDLNRIKASGPEIMLQPAAAQTLALALHELTTNAAKYGALSSLAGRLNLVWDLKDGYLVLSWNETGGPPVIEPKTHGFGSRIIRTSVERQLGGRIILDWQRDGLKCEFAVPCGEKTGVADLLVRNSQESINADTEQLIALAGNRILVVEDEAIVAMALTDLLHELGFEVVGPFGSLGEAANATGTADFDAAILDVNLDGQMIYRVADTLSKRGIPFVFVTGYGPESISSRFRHITVIQKPIEREKIEKMFLRPIANGAISAKSA
jgi:PAS domain S-box-containing protein